MSNSDRTEQLIFNGSYILFTEENEFKMSHWVKGFGITDNLTKKEILPFISSFHLEKVEEIGDRLKVQFQVYPNGINTLEAEVDPYKGTFSYNGETYALNGFYDLFKDIALEVS